MDCQVKSENSGSTNLPVHLGRNGNQMGIIQVSTENLPFPLEQYIPKKPDVWQYIFLKRYLNSQNELEQN